MYNNDLFKMNLQLFADEPQTEPAQQEPAPETEPAPERKYTQAEVDAAIASRLSRANKDLEKRIEAARQEARSEAEKLAKMNAERRAEHERQEAEKAAMDELAKRKLPADCWISSTRPQDAAIDCESRQLLLHHESLRP